MVKVDLEQISIISSLYSFKSVTFYSNTGRFVAVGFGGVITTSLDGIEWTSIISPTMNNLTRVTVSDTGRFVAVGNSGTIITSPDGLTGWTSVLSGTTNNLLGVKFVNNRFIALGSGDISGVNNTLILASVNGIDWASQPSAATIYSLYDIAVNSTGLLVLVGGAGKIFTSDDDGVSWVSRISQQNNSDLQNITVNSSNIFVAVSDNSEIITSSNGIDWDITYSESYIFQGVNVNSSGNFFACGSNSSGQAVVTSSDGSLNSWTPVVIPQNDNTLYGITLNTNTGSLVAVGIKYIITSTDNGSSWTSVFPLTIKNLYGVAVNSMGRYVAVGDNGTIVTSDNGLTGWASVTSGISGVELYGVACNSTGRFVAVGTVFNITGTLKISIITSNDGMIWDNISIQVLPIFGNYSIAAHSDGTFIAVGDYGSILTFHIIMNSNICFPKGTPVLTDQGLIAIDKIDIKINTINQKKIVDITKTISKETFLVCFDKDALGIDMPNQETIITQGHQIFYEGAFHEANWFLEKFSRVKSIPYTGEPLYNVLMEKHDVINVNNLICETLRPDNPIAKFYTKQCKLSIQDREIMIKVLQGCLDRNDIDSYNKILQCC